MGCYLSGLNNVTGYQLDDFVFCYQQRESIKDSPQVPARCLSHNPYFRNAICCSGTDSKVFDSFGIQNVSSAFALLLSKVPIDKSLWTPIYSFLPAPASLGCVALAYICWKFQLIEDCLESILSEYSSFFIDCIKGPEKDLQEHSLLFLTLALKAQNKGVKEILIRSRTMEACIHLMKANKKSLRIFGIEVCAEIFKDYEDGKRVFLRNRGEWELVQLIKREGDSDNAFLYLLNCIFDLIYVTII